MRLIQLAGEKFGRLTVIERAPNRNGKITQWLCECECGTELVVQAVHLRTGHTRSCGCLKRDMIASTGRANLTHGHRIANSRTYETWRAMIRRCELPTNDNYRYYGAKGVRVCSRWRNSFEAFLEDMGERPAGKTIDRINPEGNYEPGNCRWATPLEQRHNQRMKKKPKTLPLPAK